MGPLNGRICAVTGANSGLGKATASGLAACGACVIMICRDRERGERAREEIEGAIEGAALRLRLADLGSLAQVRSLGEDLAGELNRLDVLVNNAGVYRAELEKTGDGLEKTMAVNHLAHFLLTRMLLEPLQAAEGRVINVSSESHRTSRLQRAPLESILLGEANYNGYRAYSDSKAANILFTRELARRYGGAGLTTAAVHPGGVATRIWNQNRNFLSLVARLFKPFMRSPQSGAEPILRLAADADAAEMQGRYFNRMRSEQPAGEAADPELGMQLWELSERLCGIAG
jgi:NAD(P)-dependent dehydrogenase (short-subunit alcohol dehydrogenase family)